MSSKKKQKCFPDFSTTADGLLRSPHKVDSILEAFALALARLLSMRHFEIGRAPFGKILYQEKTRFPTQHQLDLLEDVYEALSFVVNAHSLGLYLDKASRQAPNILLDLPKVSAARAFRTAWTFERSRASSDDPASTTSARIGLVQRQISLELMEHTYDFLIDCDQRMSAIFDDHDEQGEDEEKYVEQLCDLFAYSIAERVSCGVIAAEDTDQIGPYQLSDRADAEVARTAKVLGETSDHELNLLQGLHTIAVQGVTGTDARHVIDEQLHAICSLKISDPLLNLPLLAIRGAQCGSLWDIATFGSCLLATSVVLGNRILAASYAANWVLWSAVVHRCTSLEQLAYAALFALQPASRC